MKFATPHSTIASLVRLFGFALAVLSLALPLAAQSPPATDLLRERLPAEKSRSDSSRRSAPPADTRNAIIPQSVPKAGAATKSPAAAEVPEQREAAARSTKPIREAIAETYELTKTAATKDEFTAVVDQCLALQKRNLTEVQIEYLQRLCSWGWNRRGELYADQAATLVARGETDQAARLDQLALEDFEAAVAADPTRWKAIHNRGVSYAVIGEYDQAVADFTKTVELNPEYGSAWFNRAELHYELERYDEAIADYTQALKLDSEDAAAYLSRGHALFRLRQFPQALQDYDRAVQLLPDDAEALTNRGDGYRATGQWEQAAADYRQAIALAPELGRAYQSAAWLMATCPDERYRNEELALQAAERAIELDGQSDYRYLDTLAAAYANAGLFEQARAVARQAVEAAPKSLAGELKNRLTRYESEQPYRQAVVETAGRFGANAPGERNADAGATEPAARQR